jgi:hypothetical protein
MKDIAIKNNVPSPLRFNALLCREFAIRSVEI